MSGIDLRERLENLARERDDDAAVVVVRDSDTVTITWRSLLARSRAVVEALTVAEVSPGDAVSIECGDAATGLVALHACWVGGFCAVATGTRRTGDERNRIRRDGVAVAVVRDDGVVALAVDAESRALAAARDAALCIATSGSTGSPRVAEIGADALAAASHASAVALGLERGDRWLAAMPMTHVGGVAIVARALCTGATVVLAPWTDAAGLVRDVQLGGATVVSVVPTMLRRVVALGETGRACSSVRATLVGGAAAAPELLAAARVLGWRPRATYGLTEACAQVTLAEEGDDATCGAAVPGTEVRVVDADGDGLGEIEVRGPTLFAGWRRADGALEGAVAGWYPTGDVGALRDGRLTVAGRRDDRITTGGEKVWPAPVEDALRALDGVADAAVIGVPDAEWGSAVVALVEPDAGAEPDADELRRALRGRVAYPAVPRRIVFVAALPRTTSGKIRRDALAALATTTEPA